MYRLRQNILVSKLECISTKQYKNIGIFIILITVLHIISKISIKTKAKITFAQQPNNAPNNIDTNEFNRDTLVNLFEHFCCKYAKYNALSVKKQSKWIYMTYKEYFDNTIKFARALSMLNLDTKDSVGIMGQNSPGWFIAHMGSITYGLKSVGIYGTSNEHICKYIANHSNVKVLVVDKKNHLTKFVREALRAIIVYDDIVTYHDFDFYKKHYNVSLFTWKQFMLLSEFSNWKIQGTKFYKKKIATLIYTSGTTGDPKAVALSHKNIIASMKNIFYGLINKIQLNITNEKFISYLPLNHIAAQMLDIYMPIIMGGTVYFADKNALTNTLPHTLIEIKPTIFMGVPRVWEKFKKIIEKKLPNNVLRDLVLCKASSLVSKGLGLDKCKLCITGAAPIDKETSYFFNKIRKPLIDIYGMSETTGPITMSNLSEFNVGKSLPLTKIKILKKLKNDTYGEILVKGPTIFSGYYNNPNETNNSFYGKWFKTGDLGYFDKAHYLHIVGRSKEIIITKGGENIAPIPIEQEIKKNINEISNVVVIGDKRKYLTALISIKSHKNNNTLINKALELANKHAASKAHTIKKYILIKTPFSYEGGEFTNTLKLKRKFIEEKYKKEIELMY